LRTIKQTEKQTKSEKNKKRIIVQKREEEQGVPYKAAYTQPANPRVCEKKGLRGEATNPGRGDPQKARTVVRTKKPGKREKSGSGLVKEKGRKITTEKRRGRGLFKKE